MKILIKSRLKLWFVLVISWLSGVSQVPLLSASSGERANLLLEVMGGKEAWAKVEVLKVEATHFRMASPTSYSNLILNDLTQPKVLFEAHAPGIDRWTLMDGDSGKYRRDNEAISELSEERHEEDLDWWTTNVYRTIRRLALEDPELEAKEVGEGRLEFWEGGMRLNWFRLNADGEPVMFGTRDSETGTIFGPLMKHPSGIRFPAWGAGDSGSWRYRIDSFFVNPELDSSAFKIPEPA